MVVLRRKNFGIASKILGVINPSWWLSKEASKLAYEDNPKKYKRKRFLSSYVNGWFPDVARKRLDTAVEMKKSGATPKEIRNTIYSKDFNKREWSNVGKNILTLGLYDAYHDIKNGIKGLSYRRDPYRAKFK